MRCKEEDEIPSLRENAGRVSGPRFLRRNFPSLFCKEAATIPVCPNRFPTCGKSYKRHLTVSVWGSKTISHKSEMRQKWIMSKKAKILVVEDEAPVAMLMVFLLNGVNCEVQTAWNADKALRLAQESDFDLITLDIDLPGASGLELCKTLKGNSRSLHTPIIFVSAHPCNGDQDRALELGAVDYIVKPFDALDFTIRILSHCKANGFKAANNPTELIS